MNLLKRGKMSTKLNQFFVDAPPPNINILIFDVYNMVYRCFFTAYFEFMQHKNAYQQGIENKEYTEIEMFEYWKHLFLNSFFSNVRRVQPNRIIMAIEGRGEIWRKKIYPEYKANRHHDDKEVDFEAFKIRMRAFLDQLKMTLSNVYFIAVENTEADDVMAVLTKNLSKNTENKIEIISSDSDLIQLQTLRNVRQFNATKQEYITSINPKVDLEAKILSGDSSDNISGIFKGCGPKTAIKIIDEGLDEYLTNQKAKKSKKELNEEEIKKIYERNLKIISFEYIPLEYQENILKEFNDYKINKIDPMKVYNFFVSNGLSKQLDDWQMNFHYFKELI